ncbi:hypothetical protein AG1IA_07361 [Rhizoctonia solani AG-1 IA]|uniref:Uncharacterized protein n=1 Tax=Thanatephorus cucumeris (strain AG1-IA) TaxID=983506 RepID=L8WP92_THACA|nr:hypothetical protein AG1IA_07361 [Rhizoctonia solani AG-1 IA]
MLDSEFARAITCRPEAKDLRHRALVDSTDGSLYKKRRVTVLCNNTYGVVIKQIDVVENGYSATKSRGDQIRVERLGAHQARVCDPTRALKWDPGSTGCVSSQRLCRVGRIERPSARDGMDRVVSSGQTCFGGV